MNDIDVVDSIYQRYCARYGANELQGCCLLIADEIQGAIGGECVAGYLKWYGGSCSRSHWWVEKDGVVFDPMGDELLKWEVGTSREEEHRDRCIFENLLLSYEIYRVG